MLSVRWVQVFAGRALLENETDAEGAPGLDAGGLSDDESGWVDLVEDPFHKRPGPDRGRAQAVAPFRQRGPRVVSPAESAEGVKEIDCVMTDLTRSVPRDGVDPTPSGSFEQQLPLRQTYSP